MKIALASDHAGYELKKAVAEYLVRQGHRFRRFRLRPGGEGRLRRLRRPGGRGASSRGNATGPSSSAGPASAWAIVANKFKGIRATPCWNDYTAEMSRRHNDSNCLTLGGRVLTAEEGVRYRPTSGWRRAFEGGRHAARLDKIREIENRNFK